MPSMANVPTLNGITDSRSWAKTLAELAKNASAAVSVRAIRDFLFIFLSRAGH
jgi:hypothetical protein